MVYEEIIKNYNNDAIIPYYLTRNIYMNKEKISYYEKVRKIIALTFFCIFFTHILSIIVEFILHLKVGDKYKEIRIITYITMTLFSVLVALFLLIIVNFYSYLQYQKKINLLVEFSENLNFSDIDNYFKISKHLMKKYNHFMPKEYYYTYNDVIVFEDKYIYAQFIENKMIDIIKISFIK